MVTRLEQAQRRREQLIDAALTVFAERGVDGASIKDIADAASVTPGLLYHYFDSKDDLVGVILAERGFLPRLSSLLHDQAGLPLTEVLPRLVRAFDETLGANADLVSVFFSASRADTRLAEFVGAGQELLRTYLESHPDSSEFRSELFGAAAATIFASVAIGHKTGRRVDTDALVELVMGGLHRK